MDTISKKRIRQDNMKALIETYLKGAGLTQRQFCQNNNIALSTFQFHLRKYRQQSIADSEPIAHFIPLTLSDQASPSGRYSECEIAWPNGLVIRFSTTPAPDYLLALIKANSQRI
jgi:hypothetical protein